MPKAVEPTVFGRSFVERAKLILNEIDRSVQELKSLSVPAGSSHLLERVLHEARHGEAADRRAGVVQQVDHADRGGDQPGPVLPRRVAPKRFDHDNAGDAVAADRVGGGGE